MWCPSLLGFIVKYENFCRKSFLKVYSCNRISLFVRFYLYGERGRKKTREEEFCSLYKNKKLGKTRFPILTILEFDPWC